MLKHMNSACIENVFSQVKSKDKHPDPVQFMDGLKRLATNEICLSKSRNSIGKDSPSFVTRQELIAASHLLEQQEVQRDADLSQKVLKFDSSELSNEEGIRVKSIIENCALKVNLNKCRACEKSKQMPFKALKLVQANLNKYILLLTDPSELTIPIFVKKILAHLRSEKLVPDCLACQYYDDLVHKFVICSIKETCKYFSVAESADFSSLQSFRSSFGNTRAKQAMKRSRLSQNVLKTYSKSNICDL